MRRSLAVRPILSGKPTTGSAGSSAAPTMALLRAESIDWERRTVTFIKLKAKALCHPAFGSECAGVLGSLPSSGQLFSNLSTVRESDRATEFKHRCQGLGIEGSTLHSYRYAWAERAASAGMPERYAQAALGHGSKSVHRAYARRAELHVPCLEELTETRRMSIAKARIEAGHQEFRVAA